MNTTNALRISAIMGFLAVALGAFGAHGLKAILESNGQLGTWEKAAHYHLVHAVALVALSLCGKLRVWPWRLWLAGTVIFSGTLYVLAMTNVKWLGAITPIGGTLLLAGWLALAFSREKA